MQVLILGGSGFIGTALVRALLGAGHAVRGTTRGPGREVAGQQLVWQHWDGYRGADLVPLLNGVDAIINLQGENIGAGRWTAARKRDIVQSRLRVGEALTEACLHRKAQGWALPHTLLQASACGYYGSWPDASYAPCCTEDDPAGEGFLAEVCVAWEASTAALESLGVRRCLVRTAPVISTWEANGGFLRRMLPFFQAYVGGVLGSGRQPMSWIQLEDEVAAILFLLHHPTLQGPFNCSAPHPVNMHEFVLTLGRVMLRPTFFPIPAFVLELIWGQMAEELLLRGQKIVPARLTEAGFSFAYPRLEGALERAVHPLLQEIPAQAAPSTTM